MAGKYPVPCAAGQRTGRAVADVGTVWAAASNASFDIGPWGQLGAVGVVLAFTAWLVIWIINDQRKQRNDCQEQAKKDREEYQTRLDKIREDYQARLDKVNDTNIPTLLRAIDLVERQKELTTRLVARLDILDEHRGKA